MRISWLAPILLIAAACASSDTGTTTPLDGPGPGTDAGAPVGVGADTGTSTDPNPVVVTDGGISTIYGDGGSEGNPEECVTTKAVAPPASNPKIDIVWIVDSSQSMFDEQKRIKENLLTFTDGITQANLDVNVIMVSQSPGLTGAVNIPLPGLCPDLPPDPLDGNPFAMDPRYHFVQTYVNSADPLTAAMSAYPNYAMFLRPDSVVHFIVVTDDEAAYKGQPTPEARAQLFESDMMGQLQRPFRLHTISSPGPTPCTAQNCELDPNQGIVCVFLAANCTAANSGLTYYALAQDTNGLTASICETDWSPIFQAFQENIIKSAPLPCDYNIPPPPKGETLDTEKVNVGYTAPGASEQLLPAVNDVDACGDASAWHYDDKDAPTKVLLCPSACDTVQQGGSMNIVYGCDRIILQ